jgi:hypothetical protein
MVPGSSPGISTIFIKNVYENPSEFRGIFIFLQGSSIYNWQNQYLVYIHAVFLQRKYFHAAQNRTCYSYDYLCNSSRCGSLHYRNSFSLSDLFRRKEKSKWTFTWKIFSKSWDQVFGEDKKWPPDPKGFGGLFNTNNLY